MPVEIGGPGRCAQNAAVSIAAIMKARDATTKGSPMTLRDGEGRESEMYTNPPIDDGVFLVAVEYRGGPKDGERQPFRFDCLPPILFFPILAPQMPLGLEAPSPYLDDPRAYCHEYERTDSKYHYGIVKVSQKVLRAAKSPGIYMAVMTKYLKPIIYTHQGSR